MPNPTHTQDVVKFGTESEKGLQVTIPDGEIMWLPWSQIEHVEREPDGTGQVTMSEWIAKQKGLL